MFVPLFSRTGGGGDDFDATFDIEENQIFSHLEFRFDGPLKVVADLTSVLPSGRKAWDVYPALCVPVSAPTAGTYSIHLKTKPCFENYKVEVFGFDLSFPPKEQLVIFQMASSNVNLINVQFPSFRSSEAVCALFLKNEKTTHCLVFSSTYEPPVVDKIIDETDKKYVSLFQLNLDLKVLSKAWTISYCIEDRRSLQVSPLSSPQPLNDKIDPALSITFHPTSDPSRSKLHCFPLWSHQTTSPIPTISSSTDAPLTPSTVPSLTGSLDATSLTSSLPSTLPSFDSFDIPEELFSWYENERIVFHFSFKHLFGTGRKIYFSTDQLNWTQIAKFKYEDFEVFLKHWKGYSKVERDGTHFLLISPISLLENSIYYFKFECIGATEVKKWNPIIEKKTGKKITAFYKGKNEFVEEFPIGNSFSFDLQQTCASYDWLDRFTVGTIDCKLFPNGNFLFLIERNFFFGKFEFFFEKEINFIFQNGKLNFHENNFPFSENQVFSNLDLFFEIKKNIDQRTALVLMKVSKFFNFHFDFRMTGKFEKIGKRKEITIQWKNSIFKNCLKGNYLNIGDWCERVGLIGKEFHNERFFQIKEKK